MKSPMKLQLVLFRSFILTVHTGNTLQLSAFVEKKMFAVLDKQVLSDVGCAFGEWKDGLQAGKMLLLQERRFQQQGKRQLTRQTLICITPGRLLLLFALTMN